MSIELHLELLKSIVCNILGRIFQELRLYTIMFSYLQLYKGYFEIILFSIIQLFDTILKKYSY